MGIIGRQLFFEQIMQTKEQIDIFGQNAEVFIGAEELKEKLDAGRTGCP